MQSEQYHWMANQQERGALDAHNMRTDLYKVVITHLHTTSKYMYMYAYACM